MADHSTKLNGSEAGRVPGVVYWRVEGSLLEVSALRSVGFFNWNSRAGNFQRGCCIPCCGELRETGWTCSVKNIFNTN